MAEQKPRVPKRIAAVIINSLKGGVVPRIGLPYITVGREREIQAFLTDLGLIEGGGASFRFLVGRYGAGKSFLLQTIRTHAMGEGFVVADADLSPERRLQGNQGQGLATYRELIRNISTKTRPEGGALNLILDRWVSAVQQQVEAGGDEASLLREQLAPLDEMVHGFDFTCAESTAPRPRQSPSWATAPSSLTMTGTTTSSCWRASWWVQVTRACSS